MNDQTENLSKKPHIIVIGNEKGGTGKSTLSVHISIALLKLGKSLALIDADGRQATLSRFMDNRKNFSHQNGIDLEIPEYAVLDPSFDKENFSDPKAALDTVLNKFSKKDYILIDTPGAYTPLTRQAHFYADTLVTPLNNSYLDLDVLVQMSSGTGKRQIEKLSSYSETIFELKKRQMQDKKAKTLRWIVVRNRLSHIKTHNNEQLNEDFEMLAKRLGFVLSRGIGERVIFRQLFLQGLTVLDTNVFGDETNLSRLAALGEIKEVIGLICP